MDIKFKKSKFSVTSRNPGSSIIDFLSHRQLNGSRPSVLLSQRFDNASSLYQKDLVGHNSCVNSLDFSRGGEYLVSGKTKILINLLKLT